MTVHMYTRKGFEEFGEIITEKFHVENWKTHRTLYQAIDRATDNTGIYHKHRHSINYNQHIKSLENSNFFKASLLYP